jgi:two-component system, OmpR family, response regulator ChvI
METIGMQQSLPVQGGLQKIRVIIVEDDELYREVLEDGLEDHGFDVRGFADAASILETLNVLVEADVLLLDWKLPRISGIELLSHLRGCGIDIPVAFLTGLSLVDYESAAFARGATDFIDKSRGLDVLARRITRIVEARRKSSPVQPTLPPPRFYGPLALRPGRTEWRGQKVGLTLCEYNVVDLLASNAGNWTTYRAVYDRMHYVGFIAGVGEDGYQQNVRSTIRRIRRKFHTRDPDFAEIINQPGVGYCWRNHAV